ncbi:FecR domain-containing protein [Pseudomonas sichuanensis]|uniref:FecR domain-containing protein n=1 Tax=Pseudomonas sichuanensis TaxID=2213015 RepID=UPI002447D222|nr:FecR domain-containing protein [Pseudomonas sichuanensis]MDH0729124.1 FecR domain-containing protein [Pseudomonas sichuanensis]MDH1583536.1 FecR domain-containing protein [Pseudomonas sichuanensis]MDH1595237.1 FecR domain-containing protein [Pseudomonas sichuanensis]MDH1596147.1 FecR domain-containing protein [Pseudomonas sichuanensis]
MSRAQLDHAVLQAAAGWFARLYAAQHDPAANAQWRAWLNEDARHRLAWSYVENINQRFGTLDGQTEQARQVFDSVRRGQQSRRAVLGSLCVAGAAGLLGWGGWQRGWVDSPRAWFATYRTGLGEVRPLTLADGSQLWLNGETALDVQFDEGVRQLRLYHGEILIETGKDPRPLAVVTRAGRMQPLGTRFSVRDQGLQTTLSVFEGAVQATCSNSGLQTTLGAGQMLVFDALQASTSTAAQALRQDWSRGVLVAEDMPLGQVIDVLRDYRHGHLGIDPSLNSLRAVGTFPLLDTDRTLAMLERALPIRVVRTLPWWVSVEAN